MATITFRLRSLKTENANIYIHFSAGRGQQFQTAIDLFINPKDWKSVNKSNFGEPKNISTPQAKNLKSDLKKLELFVTNSFNEANSSGTLINPDWLKKQIQLCFERIDRNSVISPFVVHYIQKIIDEGHTFDNAKGGVGLSKNRIKGYNNLLNKVKEFNKDLLVKDCNENLFEDFKSYLIDKKFATQTYSKILSDLKTVCKYARKKGAEVSYQLNDIKIKPGSTYDEDTDVIYLTELDILKIEKVKLTSIRLLNARKWLILACYTGQRGNSLLNQIIDKNFYPYPNSDNEYYIKFRQSKGNKTVLIPVLPKVKEIYQNGLPYRLSTQKLNVAFKEIGKLAELDEMVKGTKTEVIDEKKSTKRKVKKDRPKYEYITTHIGRRSFATNHYGTELSTSLLMSVTGHSKESTFLKYINQRPMDNLDKFFTHYKTKKPVVESKIIELKSHSK